MKTDEVLELPEQVVTEIEINTSKQYKQFQKICLVEIDGVELVGDTELTKRLYSRQLCGQYSSDKLSAFKDLLQSTNDRLIVFYNFTDELKSMIPIAHELKKPFGIVNGERKELEPYDMESNSITFVQYQAGAMGLNLQKANKVIYFTLPDGRQDLFDQSMKRIHRIGQKNTCFYYILLCRDSVEEEILKTLNIRKEYTDELFKEGE
jgi:SNF2 family DNA or RNA helicase